MTEAQSSAQSQLLFMNVERKKERERDTEVRESRKMFIMAHACTEHTRLVGDWGQSVR